MYGDNFTLKEVDMLYRYFEYEGFSNRKQIRCHPQNWRINKEHIYGALRRHQGNVHKAGEDLSELLQNENFEIRTFYAKLQYSEFVASENNTVYTKPYLSGQEWQVKPEEGMYLLYDNKVFQITRIYDYGYNNIHLKRVLTRDNTCISRCDKDVRFGKYKQISLDGVTFFDSRLQTYLKKEYDLLCNEFEEIKKQEIIWFNLRLKNREEHVSSIQKIQKYHENNCTTEAKLKIVGKFDLPIFVIKKILSYNIESVCFHDWEIKDFECDIENIDIMIDRGYKPYIEMKIQQEIAEHVLKGDYDFYDYDLYDYIYDKYDK